MGTSLYQEFLKTKTKAPADSTLTPQPSSLYADFQSQQKSSLVTKDVSGDGFWETLGNYGRYVHNLAGTKDPWIIDPKVGTSRPMSDEERHQTIQVGQALGKNIGTLASDVESMLGFSGPIDQFQTAKKYAGPVLDQLRNTSPGSLPFKLAKGTALSVASIPIDIASTLTGTKMGPNGSVLPRTPEEEAQGIQSSIGLVLAGGAASKVMKIMTPTSEVLLGLKAGPGLLVKAAFPKAVSGMAAGGVYGGMSSADNEDALASALVNGLAGATIGALWRPFKAANALNGARFTSLVEDHQRSQSVAQELAATRAMQITPKDSPIDIANKTKAFAISDNSIEAFINSQLSSSKQVILDDPNVDVDKLIEKYNPSPRVHEGPYNPSPETQQKLANTKWNIGEKGKGKKIWVNYIDTFDKAVIASATDESILEELKSHTGLTDAEIKSHRSYIQSQHTKFQPRQQTPFETGQESQLTMDRGKSIVDNLQEGQSAKGWLKVKDKLTNGQEVIPVNSPETWKLLGSRGVAPTDPIVDVPKQNFNPEFGRELDGGISVYKGPEGKSLISGYRMSKEQVDFFQRTGYISGELTTFNGNPATVVGGDATKLIKIQDMSTGIIKNVSPRNVQRIPTGLDSESLKAGNGELIPRLMVLNRESYFNNLYDKFKSMIPMDEAPTEPFSKTIMKFAQQSGMKNVGDIADMTRAFHAKMLDEALVDDPELQEFYKRGLKHLDEYEKSFQESTANSLHRALVNNNLSLYSRGGGVFDIKDTDGKFHTVKSLDEALEFVNSAGQANGVDHDGGGSNGQPLVGGSLTDGWDINTNKVSTRLDNFFNIDHATWLSNPKSAIAAMDHQFETDLYPHYQAMQTGLTWMRNLMRGKLKPMLDARTEAFDNSIPFEGRVKVYQQLTSMSEKNIISHFKLESHDTDLAGSIAKAGSSDVIDLMHTVRAGSNWGKIGDKGFNSAMKAAIDSKKYDPKVVAAVKQVFSISKGDNKASVLLKLAQTMEHGEFDAGGLSKEEQKFSKTVKNFYDNAHGVDDPFFAYLPHSQLAELTGYNPFSGQSESFQRTYNAYGITPNNQQTMDPLVAIHNYAMASTRTAKIIPEIAAYPKDGAADKFMSFKDITDKSQSYLNELSPKKSDTPDEVTVKDRQATARKYFREHLSDVIGIPDLSKQLSTAAQEALNRIYGADAVKSRDLIKFANSLVYSSLLGARPAFAIRDGINVMTNIADFDSYGAAKKIAGMSINREYTQKLIDDGILSQQDFLKMMNAGEDITDAMGRLSKVSASVMKLSDLATRYNGQQMLHAQLSAATYRYYYEKVGSLSAKMIENDISKKEAYGELKIGKLPPTEQAFFDGLVSAGKTEQAAKFLGKSMMDRVNVTYGNANAPLAWNTRFGKLAGGFGQWAVHQINTNIDVMTRGGSRKEILQSNAKMLINNAAIWSAGIYTGVNLSKWMILPWTLPGLSPLANGLLGVVQGSENTLNEDPAISNPAVSSLGKMLPGPDNWNHLYLPFSYFVQGELDAYDMLQGDFGPSAGAKALGFSPIKSTQSPLQAQWGFAPEWKGKLVPDRGIGPKAVQGLLSPP